ncbi:MAG: FecR domain-containing protein [Pseudomonadota bacterium]
MSAIETALRQEAHVWRIKRDAGLSPEEQREFDQWMESDHQHGAAFARAEMGWAMLDQIDFGEAALNETMLDGPQDSISLASGVVADDPIEPQPAPMLQRFAPQMAAGMATALAAAIILFFSGVPTMWFGSPEPEAEQFVSEVGQIKYIRPADGSQITLGAASRLALAMDDKQRIATLQQGNAYFDIASDQARPFTVRTDIGEVRVTGTAFDVQLRDGAIAVAVGKGEVEVTATPEMAATSSKQTTTLSAGQAVTLSGDGEFGLVTKVYPAELGAWRLGRLIYFRAPLSQVVGDINRHIDEPMTIDERAGRIEISGAFNARQIDDLLETIERELPVRIIDQNGARHIAAK